MEHQADSNNYCLFGSDSHLQALKEKLERSRAETADLTRRVEFLENSVSRGKQPADSVSSTSPASNSVLHLHPAASLNILLDGDANFAAEKQEIHVTSHTFGRLDNFQIIEHKHQGSKWYHNILTLPRIRQYFVKGKFHREKEERKTSSDELLFDLIFVVSIAKISENLHHSPNGAGLWEYILLFFPIWLLWYSTTQYLNR